MSFKLHKQFFKYRTHINKHDIVRIFSLFFLMHCCSSLFSWIDTHHMTFLTPECPLFDEIILSTDMVYHHMPWAVLHALEQVQQSV